MTGRDDRRGALPAPRAPAFGVAVVVLGVLVVFLWRFVGCVGPVSAARGALLKRKSEKWLGLATEHRPWLSTEGAFDGGHYKNERLKGTRH
jgi:hypothetical protein